MRTLYFAKFELVQSELAPVRTIPMPGVGEIDAPRALPPPPAVVTRANATMMVRQTNAFGNGFRTHIGGGSFMRGRCGFCGGLAIRLAGAGRCGVPSSAAHT